MSLGIASSGFPIPDFLGPEEKKSRFGKFQFPIGKSGNGLLTLFLALNIEYSTNIDQRMELKTNTPSLIHFQDIESPKGRYLAAMHLCKSQEFFRWVKIPSPSK